MFYVLRTAQYTTYSTNVVLEGPDVDIERLHKQFKARLDEKIGPEPNVLCYGDHKDWILRRLEVISKEGDFIKFLVEQHGFRLMLARTYVLR